MTYKYEQIKRYGNELAEINEAKVILRQMLAVLEALKQNGETAEAARLEDQVEALNDSIEAFEKGCALSPDDVRKIIRKIKKPNYKKVVRLRLLRGYEWSEITRRLKKNDKSHIIRMFVIALSKSGIVEGLPTKILNSYSRWEIFNKQRAETEKENNEQ